MKIKIENDVFDICNRLKEIDDTYYVVYDTIKNRFEIWSEDIKNILCFVVPYRTLDARTLVHANKTNSNNAKNIFEEIDRVNEEKNNSIKNKILDETSFKFREIYNYEKLSKQMSQNSSYKSRWV